MLAIPQGIAGDLKQAVLSSTGLKYELDQHVVVGHDPDSLLNELVVDAAPLDIQGEVLIVLPRDVSIF